MSKLQDSLFYIVKVDDDVEYQFSSYDRADDHYLDELLYGDFQHAVAIYDDSGELISLTEKLDNMVVTNNELGQSFIRPSFAEAYDIYQQELAAGYTDIELWNRASGETYDLTYDEEG